MTDYAARRTTMVDTQVRPCDVTKFPVIEAMLRVERELFVPRDKREAAYIGENVDLGGSRVVLDPRTLGKMLDFLELSVMVGWYFGAFDFLFIANSDSKPFSSAFIPRFYSLCNLVYGL